MVTNGRTELESLRRMHAQDLAALQAAADLIARQQAGREDRIAEVMGRSIAGGIRVASAEGRGVRSPDARVLAAEAAARACAVCGYPDADRYGGLRDALERIALGIKLGRVDLDEAARIASEALT